MLSRPLSVVAAPFLVVGAAVSPTAIVTQSDVTWADAQWKTDGSGSMPLGNGDVTANVWVDGATGELSLLVGKSDVFDENASPVKIGLVRVAFEPPLWTTTGQLGGAMDNYTKTEGAIVLQTTQFAVPSGWSCDSKASCPEQSAELCNSMGSKCQGFSLHPTWGGGVRPELSTTGETESRSGTKDWNTWSKPRLPPGPPPPPGTFEQTLNLAEASIDINTPQVQVRVFVDAERSVLRIVATGNASFNVSARVEPYRTAGATKLGYAHCHPRYDTPDTVVSPDQKPVHLKNAAVWYHHNPDDASIMTDTMMDQGVDPKEKGLHDPFAGLTFGGALFGDAFAPVGDGTTKVAGSGLRSATLNIAVLTKQVPAEEWLAEMETEAVAVPAADLASHAKTWEAIWGRSYLNITASAGASASDQADAKSVMDHAHWDRFMALVQNMQASSPIKFNGQAFTVDTGKGWDFRDWGEPYWWQNTRQPYYNSLAQGDVDVLRSMLAFYHRMLPYVQARTEAQFNGTETPITGGVAALYPETTTQFGTYAPGNWGCNSKGHRAHGASANQYIRFHWTGSLELCLLFLDDYTVTMDADHFEQKGLPVCTAVVEGFRQRFPNTVDGKTDMWPTQALETYQCPDPTSRTSCPGNVATDIAGLQAVLSRLLALPASLVASSSELRSAWSKQQSSLPDLPIADGKILPAAAGSSKRRNSENTALYAVHPFRVYGTGKADLEIAQATYRARKSPCNNGWCQDVIDAAMLNLTDDAMTQVVKRARAGAAKGFRFAGFAAHNQDYEPSLDHYAFMRTAVNYMLMSPLDDEKQGILLFPSWPADKWDVSFKMTGPLNTVVEAACEGGVLTKFVVTPKEREADVQVLNCARQGDASVVV